MELTWRDAELAFDFLVHLGQVVQRLLAGCWENIETRGCLRGPQPSHLERQVSVGLVSVGAWVLPYQILEVKPPEGKVNLI